MDLYFKPFLEFLIRVATLNINASSNILPHSVYIKKIIQVMAR